MASTLELVLIFLASAVLVVVVFRMLHLPPLLGYLLAGIAIGPHALGWIPESTEGRYLAEFGVVFLMFSIGLEFSLVKLFQMRRTVFGLGLSQVALTVAAGLAACVAAGLGWKSGLVLGSALAMSSTAIVVRMFAERLQLDTPHGRQVMGVLLFQDIAVVPFLILVPVLAQGEGELAAELSVALGKAAIVLFVLLFVGQKLMRGWFHIVARRRSHELFILNVLLITLGLAWLTQLAGLSLALGAFLAGMLIAETEYRHQVEEDIKPFREVLLGLFFVTVGMQLDLRVVRDNLILVTFLFLVPVLFKLALVAGLSRLFGGTPGTALRAGLALGQAGEFGLVIIALAASVRVLEPELIQIVVAAMLLSMLATPFLIQYSDWLVLRLATSEWMLRSLALHQVAVKSLATERHVIICGFGRTGQNLAQLFEREGIRYVALDLDPQHVSEGTAAGEPVVYGDSARRETLIAAGIARARAMVISFADTPAALRILHYARELNPGVPVVVRTRDDGDLDRLIAAGAAEVVPETFETSLMLGSHALVLLGVPLKRVLRRVQDVRSHRYSLLRGFFHGETDEPDSGGDARELRLHSVRLEPGSYATGKALRDLALEATGATVSVLRRIDTRVSSPPLETTLEEGDVLVLLGTGDQLEAAEIRLLRG
jgi:monovalent cation:H+ antiporter-2, CPA2 family